MLFSRIVRKPRAMLFHIGMVAILFMALLTSVSAAPPLVNETDKIIPFDGAESDNFGEASAIHGDTVVIAATLDDDNGPNSGSVYVYHLDSAQATLVTKLTAPDGAANDRFGSSVDIFADVIVAGTPAQGGDGAAYVYRFNRTTWAFETTLQAPSSRRFGADVEVEGDVIVVGAPSEQIQGLFNAGAVYIYRFDGNAWVQEARLTSPDLQAFDSFGTDVSISGDSIAVGAAKSANYVFRYDGTNWVQEAALDQTNPFTTLDIFGDVLVMGAADNQALVFRRTGSTWIQEAVLRPSNTTGLFGTRIALSGDVAVFGVEADSEIAENSGAAYVFRFDGNQWLEEAKLKASDAAAADEFGRSVAVDGEQIIVGAYQDIINGVTSGSAYVFAGPFDGGPPSNQAP
ncbi:MAG: FG-GAP repeat protein [Chloroflexales bacterium]|nr:FG-GAP repeat protein [Chloroflexales bacterium]